MLGRVSAGSAGFHLFPAYHLHGMGCPARCGIAWTAAGRLVRPWDAVFLWRGLAEKEHRTIYLARL